MSIRKFGQIRKGLFGFKSKVQKAYEADRDAAIRSRYGDDVWNDKKARKWAQKEYENEWLNSKDRTNFNYGGTDPMNGLSGEDYFEQFKANNIKTDFNAGFKDASGNLKEGYKYNSNGNVIFDQDWGNKQIADAKIRYDVSIPTIPVRPFGSNINWNDRASQGSGGIYTTQDQVAAFQKANGITVDGKWGNDTQKIWDMLQAGGHKLADGRDNAQYYRSGYGWFDPKTNTYSKQKTQTATITTKTPTYKVMGLTREELLDKLASLTSPGASYEYAGYKLHRDPYTNKISLTGGYKGNRRYWTGNDNDVYDALLNMFQKKTVKSNTPQQPTEQLTPEQIQNFEKVMDETLGNRSVNAYFRP